MKFYVYKPIDPRNNTVFYIGKGSRRRWKEHWYLAFTEKGSCNPHKDRKIRHIKQDGYDCYLCEFAFESDDEEFCYSKEMELISEYGIDNLVNCALGGNGTRCGKPKSLLSMKGTPHTPESKAKISQSKKGCRSWRLGIKFTDEEWLKYISNRPDQSGEKNPMWGRMHGEETKNKISQRLSGNKNASGKIHSKFVFYENEVLVEEVKGQNTARQFCLEHNIPFQTLCKNTTVWRNWRCERAKKQS